MKEKLREMDIRLTELSGYLKISRPTLYKYMEMYENGEKKGIPSKIRNFFAFIDKEKTVSKEMVIKYVMANFCNFDDKSIKNDINAFLLETPENDIKIQFIKEIISNDEIDSVIPYLHNSIKILKKESIDEVELQQVAKFVKFRDEITTNKPAGTKEINFAKEKIGDRCNEK